MKQRVWLIAIAILLFATSVNGATLDFFSDNRIHGLVNVTGRNIYVGEAPVLVSIGNSGNNAQLNLRGGTAYIDFANDGTGRDARIIRTGDDALEIQSTNVGIGGNPSTPLHVFSDANPGGATSLLTLSADASDRPLLQFSEQVTSGANSGMSIEYDGRLSADNNKLNINGLNGVPRFTITSGGNVGIGTTTPDKLVTIANTGSDQFTMHLLRNHSSGDVKNRVLFESINSSDELVSYHIGIGMGENFRITETNGDGTIALTQDRKMGVMTAWPRKTIEVNGSAYFDGFVGLGVLDPTSRLQVAGGTNTVTTDVARFGSSGAGLGTENRIVIGGNDNHKWGAIGARDDGVANQGSLRFYTLTGGVLTRQMTILHNGNVGIGAGVPTETLDVNGNVRVRGSRLFVGTGQGYVFGDDTNLGVRVPSNSGGFYVQRADGNDYATLYAGGVVISVGRPATPSNGQIWIE